ncbi:hypothetical protein [Cyclobacterium qasimii]|uniref:Uncharacterized protein n=2 Tax=Cyclobacterium qasimii TaxID=1350429 RepID=S7VDF8_9BACT|nr:hypothetical protein [Cyclobacterium qasimii]EPR67597.1 hypothetical protein ADICYQ_3385 [Cyclobacterium qasimii M12-11B]GEO20909.1 hypothetical protein CQA01_14430 [Cyclobacterium qasimii]
MDSSTVFYIIAVIIYFIYTSFAKKKADNEGPEMDENDNVPNQGPSFEELLRDIRNEQHQEVPEETEEEWVEPIPRRGYQELNKTEEYAEVEKPPVKEGEFISAYRGVRQPLVKLDDQVDIENDQKLLGEVVDVAGEYQNGNKYARLLKNPETIKEAVVLTEVFNRRHF